MKSRIALCLIFVFLAQVLTAQTIRFEISSLPPTHDASSPIYIAGSFNGWNPKDEKFRFKKDEQGRYYFETQLTPGSYEYKITKGGWDKVETQKSGTGITNRSLKVEGNATVGLQIEEWQDKFPSKPRQHTASRHVKIIDTAFFIPQLNRTRRVWIYLPENYSSTVSRYPVLYIHDGQNVFDDATSFSGEWGVDEFLDSIGVNQIVVGIDHGGAKRINEYCPYDMEKFGKGEGDQYVDFLVKTLKPFIDKNYRTEKDRESTSIAGSSMGGLISMYAVLKYPKTFGGVGVFSPAFWVGPKIFDDIKKKGSKVKSNIFFYAGKEEGESMVPDMLKAFEGMSKVSKSRMKTVIRDEGKHNEPRWRLEFPCGFFWMDPILSRKKLPNCN